MKKKFNLSVLLNLTRSLTKLNKQVYQACLLLITISLINYACEKTPNSNGELKPRIDNNVEKVSVYPCNSTTCNDHIQCPNDPLCNFRKDLNPCDYANMELYANAVACELTRLVKARRDCPIPAQYSPCENGNLYENVICIKDLETPPALIALFGGQDVSPWRYCGNSGCQPQPYECTFGTFIKWHHIFLNQAAQDILVNYILAIIIQFENDGTIQRCSPGSALKYREIKIRNCYDSPIPIICGPNSPICTNMSLTIQVT